MTQTPNWAPFDVVPRDGIKSAKADLPRALETRDGIGDRLRVAGFAELQAREAFLWASRHLPDAQEELKKAWVYLAGEEDRHLNWLLGRLKELEIPIEGRRVSDQLWASLTSCKTAEEFAIYMASAEERGRVAGVRFYQGLAKTDPITAEIFRKIAEEEVSHIALAERFFAEQFKQDRRFADFHKAKA